MFRKENGRKKEETNFKSIYISNKKQMEDIKIKLLSEDKARLEKVEDIYWIYYNTLPYKGNSTIQLEIEVESDSQRSNQGV